MTASWNYKRKRWSGNYSSILLASKENPETLLCYDKCYRAVIL